MRTKTITHCTFWVQNFSLMKRKITKITATNQKISGRGGITFFLKYVENTMFYELVEQQFIKFNMLNNRGLSLFQFIKQILAFFIDGTNMSITSFDKRKEDEAYTAVLENEKSDMASSHQIKRFFKKLSIVPNIIFRKILRKLFIWRLLIEQPKLIELFVDTMVLNNDDAKKREGCEPTYKPVKGFQPLHVIWNNLFVDVLFRKGSSHSNHGTDYVDTVRDIVGLIRKKYRKDVPIIVKTDGGFFDQKAFEFFEKELKIMYVSGGTLYKSVKESIEEIKQVNANLINENVKNKKSGKQETPLLFNKFQKGKQIWNYTELGSRLVSWKEFRRCIYIQLLTEDDGQFVLDFQKSDSLIYTNIGMNKELNEQLIKAGYSKYLEVESIINLSHSKGNDELAHRSIKEFAGKEQLPFQKFGMNAAYYYLLVIAHFLFETYKIDVTNKVVAIKSYPTTFRRTVIDFAVKIVYHSRQIIMQVARDIYKTLKINDLWKKCQTPPKILQLQMLN